MFVELGALVVEDVTELVTHDDADRAVVDRRVGRRIEEQPLHDPGGEHDLHQHRVRLRVHGVSQHRPLVARHRRPELGHVARVLETRRVERIAETAGRGRRCNAS